MMTLNLNFIDLYVAQWYNHVDYYNYLDFPWTIQAIVQFYSDPHKRGKYIKAGENTIK